MKFRKDFVTNSSSSSFIGVFAEINDEEKANEIIKKHHLEQYVKNGSLILEEMSKKYFYGYGAEWANVYIDVNRNDIDIAKNYIVWKSYGGAGDDDSCFMTGDYGWSDLDYDVDLSDFRNKEQEIFNDISETNGFSGIQSGYGAGRNG